MEQAMPRGRGEAAPPAGEKVTRYTWFVVVMSLAGWALVSMDGAFFTFAMPPIMEEFKIDLISIGYLITIGFALGGAFSLVAGALADYWGRKRVFQATLLATVLGSLLSAVSWGFGSLTSFRALTQIGNCAEWSVGQQILAEEAPSKGRGGLQGLAQLGWPLGWFMAVLIAMVVVPTLGWRWLFVVGIIPAAVVLIARRWLREPPRAADVEHLRAVAHSEAEARKVETEFAVAKEKAIHFTFRQLFEPDLLRTSIFLFGFTFFHTFGNSIAIWLLPILVMGMGYTLTDVYMVSAIGMGTAVVGYILHGWLGDRMGRREAILAFTPVAMAGYVLWANFTPNLPMLILWYTISYFFMASVYPSIVGLTMESYPTRARGTGAAYVLGVGVWGGIMVIGLVSPRLVEAYGIPGALMIHAGLMAVGWIFLLFVKRVAPRRVLEEVII